MAASHSVLAADPNPGDAAEVLTVFMPWVCAVSTLLDSYVDQAEDAEDGNHSYLAHYESPTTASKRLAWLISTSARDAGTRYAPPSIDYSLLRL